MPIIKSAQKRMRQDQKRYANNLRVKRELRVATKDFKAKPSFDGMRDVQSKIDTAVKKNVFKKNTAARRMAQISRIAKEAGVKIPTAKKPTTKTVTKPAAKKVAPKTTPKATAAKKPAAKKTAAKK